MTFFGKILKVRGNKGEVVITSPLKVDYALTNGESVRLKSEKYEKQEEIEYFREIKGAFIIKFKGINSINDALTRVGYSIFTERDKTEPAEPADGDMENYHIENFIVKDINGEVWGKVEHFDTEHLNPLLEVRADDQSEICYIPFSEEIIKEIDPGKRVIIIDPPVGLKDLNK
ncbi:MAG: 16S rRNA processing protein RimM [bacterium]|nr:16S rRNA processing protein RimM [bacterium]